MHELHHTSVTTGDGVELSLLCRHAAASRGTVLLLHGFGQNARTWHSSRRSFISWLAEAGWDVCAADLRGHGRSRENGAPYARSLSGYLRGDLPALLDAVRRSARARPLVVIGHSLGGLMAGFMAVRNPGAIDGVGMVATPGRMALAPEFAAARMLPFVRRFVPGVETFTAMPFRLDWLGRLTAAAIRVTGDRAWPLGVQAWNPGSMEDDLLRERLEEGFDVTGWGVVSELANWANTGRLEVPGVSPDLVAELQQLNLPLLLVSSPADGIVTAGMAARRTAFPRARVHQYVVPDFGHCDIVLGRRAPEMVWRPMLDWLEALA